MLIKKGFRDRIDSMKFKACDIYRVGILASMVVLLGSCSLPDVRSEHKRSSDHTASSTSYRKVNLPRPDSRRLQPSDFATGSQLIHGEKPVFPTFPKGTVVPNSVSVVTLLSVGTQGTVYGVTILSSSYSGPYLRYFLESIDACVKKWRFNPLVVYEHHEVPGQSQIVIEKASPFSDRFQFNFNGESDRKTSFSSVTKKNS
jgi:hypothetical protein